MRDINRIEPFMEFVTEQWKKVPDMRFGQFMETILNEVNDISNKDIFYMEDNETMEYIKKIKWLNKDENEMTFRDLNYGDMFKNLEAREECKDYLYVRMNKNFNGYDNAICLENNTICHFAQDDRVYKVNKKISIVSI